LTPLEKYGYNQLRENTKIGTFYGPEDDVLARYYHCAKRYEADWIVRVTADCPLVLWEDIDDVLEQAWLYNCPYTSANESCNGLNVEAFSMGMLAIAHCRATEDYDREHVTPYMKRNMPEGRPHHPFEFHSKYPRVTIDEEKDLEFLRKICTIVEGGIDAPWLEFVKVFNAHPELLEINAGVKQK